MLIYNEFIALVKGQLKKNGFSRQGLFVFPICVLPSGETWMVLF